MEVDEALGQLKSFSSEMNPKLQRLREIDLFVLDNSLRESTVGALRGHTLEDKFKIFEQTKKVGFKHNIVAAFSHMTRVDDVFIKGLVQRGEDLTDKYAFSEFADKMDDDGVPTREIPIGMQKCKELGLKNVIIEVDLAYAKGTKFTHEDRCTLFRERFQWIRENLDQKSRILINLRDLPVAMKLYPRLLLQTVKFLSEYQPQIFAIITEEPSGKNFPEELGVMTKVCTNLMKKCGFNGHFLVHIHAQWGLHDAGQLECLANGATGIWCGIAQEGAALGHASSCLTLMNLIRLGNKKVLKKFDCKHLRSAASTIHKVVTGKDPEPKQPIYGSRAVDQVFGLGGMGGSGEDEFSLADFFDIQTTKRITTLATEGMIVDRMTRLYGADSQFTIEIANKMKLLMLEDLRGNKKEEYHSLVGLGTLFDRAGGQKTEKMIEAMAKFQVKSLHIQGLIDELHDQWRSWDLRNGVLDDCLDFDNFYDGFMKNYFGCYRCSETKQALKAINVNDDESIDWNEFVVFLKWAGHEYPKTETAEDLLDVAFREAIIPAMQDELVKEATKDKYVKPSPINECHQQ